MANPSRRYCQHCHGTDNLMIHYVSKAGRKAYMCRPCNTDRQMRYRLTKKGRANVNAAARRWYLKNRGKSQPTVDLIAEARENRLGIIERHP